MMKIIAGEKYIQKYFKLYPVTVKKVSKKKVWIKDTKFKATFVLNREDFEKYYEEFTIRSMFCDTIL